MSFSLILEILIENNYFESNEDYVMGVSWIQSNPYSSLVFLEQKMPKFTHSHFKLNKSQSQHFFRRCSHKNLKLLDIPVLLMYQNWTIDFSSFMRL